MTHNTDSQFLLDVNAAACRASNIIGAYADQQQNIWMLSSKGLSLKHSDSQRMITFTRQDGLVATELVFKSFFDDQQGTFYIGSIDGLTLIEPALIWINQIEPKVAVSRILVNNKALADAGQHSALAGYCFKAQQTPAWNLSLPVSIFTTRRAINIMYKLNGFDD